MDNQEVLDSILPKDPDISESELEKLLPKPHRDYIAEAFEQAREDNGNLSFYFDPIVESEEPNLDFSN